VRLPPGCALIGHRTRKLELSASAAGVELGYPPAEEGAQIYAKVEANQEQHYGAQATAHPGAAAHAHRQALPAELVTG